MWPTGDMKLKTQSFTERDLHWDTMNQGLKIKDKDNFESRKRKKTHHKQGNPKKAISKFLSRSLAVQERMGYSKRQRKKSVNQVYFTQQSCPSEMKEKKRVSQKIIKKLITDLKTKVDSSEIIVGDFSTALSTTNRSSRQKINTKIKYLLGRPYK